MTMLETFDLDAIERRAQRARPGRALVFVILAVPFVLGWLVRRAWMAGAFLASAVLAGWQAAGGEGLDDERDGRSGEQARGWS